jgi:hypothetical protein
MEERMAQQQDNPNQQDTRLRGVPDDDRTQESPNQSQPQGGPDQHKNVADVERGPDNQDDNRNNERDHGPARD